MVGVQEPETFFVPNTPEDNTPEREQQATGDLPPVTPLDPKGVPALVPILSTPSELSSTSALEPDSSRQEKWNQVMGAIKENLPHMIRTTSSPRKIRRIPDKLDPEPKAQPIRLPLHPSITSALEACERDIKPPKGGDLGKDTPKLQPDRQAPRVFFKPEGFGEFFEAAHLDPNFRDLHKGSGTAQAQLPANPKPVQVPEADIIQREQTARVILCIESVRRWAEDAAIEAAEALEAHEATAQWGRALAEVLGMMRSLSTLTLDRITTDLVNSVLTRRDMWLRTLCPKPRGKKLIW